MNNSLAQKLQASVSEEHKEWEDLNYDQKFEKLMQVVTRMFDTINQQSGTIYKLKETLNHHEHDAKGDVFTREYLDRGLKTPYGEIPVPSYFPHISNPLNVKALKPMAENDSTQMERPY